MYASLRVKGKKPFKCMLLRRKTWIWNTFRGNPAPSPRIKGKTDEDARVLCSVAALLAREVRIRKAAGIAVDLFSY